ncbi:2EXR domain-containing protein [Fusarium falciforme]|uniref:2EXR domain-containing protein n=1 Tax=Fusarium falciforme TaxID=195108 RepID=UPI0023004EA6|nr:2EXR domain-containing protein [Fusarium falciforme]WAO93533.1 2EXR domain-containing protein [Fusarium falciforme]
MSVLSLSILSLLEADLTSYWYRPWDPWVEGPTSNDYVIVLSQRPIISKLFRVNTEARSCASRFYRVQLPCTYQCGDHAQENGTLYFNPELDILTISGFEYFVKFAHDIWVHDPRHVGLRNMALFDHRVRPMYTHEKKNNRLREVVSRLQRIMFPFMQEYSAEFRRVRFPGTNDTIPRLKPLFYRPIMPATPIFHRRPDRRPIQAELRQVFISSFNPQVKIHK